MVASRRIDFDNKLREILGSTEVWFQPPADVKMKYPCITYERDVSSRMSADNQAYVYMQGYQVTYIDRNPDSDVIDKLAMLPYSDFQTHFATSGLNHDVFVIYH